MRSSKNIRSALLDDELLGVYAKAGAVLGDKEGVAEAQVVGPFLVGLHLLQHLALVVLGLVEVAERAGVQQLGLVLGGLRVELAEHLLALLLLLEGVVLAPHEVHLLALLACGLVQHCARGVLVVPLVGHLDQVVLELVFALLLAHFRFDLQTTVALGLRQRERGGLCE